jgi:hypothetical protein
VAARDSRIVLLGLMGGGKLTLEIRRADEVDDYVDAGARCRGLDLRGPVLGLIVSSVSISGIQLAKAAGAKAIYATAGSQEKIDFLETCQRTLWPDWNSPIRKSACEAVIHVCGNGQLA